MDKIQNKFYRKELEVNALLEITQAVNNNLPEEDLYKIFEFTLRANLQLDKMALYVKEENWECKVQFGTKKDFSQLPMDTGCLDIKKITQLSEVDLSISCFTEFDIIIPILHKERLLAFVFLKSVKEDDTDAETTFVQALSNIILVAIENKRLARRQLEQQAFLRDMEIAKNVQHNLFPKNLPVTDSLEVKAFYKPSQTVGGDYYDYIDLPDQHQFMVCIADVSGKGIPAALLMSNFQAVLRTLSRKGQNLEEVVHELNYQLMANANGENFITFFVAVYDYQTRDLRYVNAGHNPPVLISGKDELLKLTEGTTILGAFEPLPFLSTGKVDHLDAFSLFLFTDGVTETFNDAGDEYGPERLEAFLQAQQDAPLDSMHKDLITELTSFGNGRPFSDDLTFLSCRLKNVSA
jgi:sigma-B regulation protein RsbU (phosphoserine phosphatase)